MAPMLWRSNKKGDASIFRLIEAAAKNRSVPIFLLALAAPVWAQDLAFSASVDKTTVDAGNPVTLTLTLSGDISGVELPKIELPEGIGVAAQSQSTNFSLRAGAAQRSISLAYVLIPREPGMYRLGPFKVTHQKKEFQTEPIELTVKKPALPPSRLAPGERFTL